MIFNKLAFQHALSRFLGFFAHCRWSFFKNGAIRIFIKHFKVDLSEAQVADINEFKSFNEFFIRKLKPELRPFPEDSNSIISPADGKISELGLIEQSRLLQVKGKYYDLQELMGGETSIANLFVNGHFITTYLSPRDYHRVHMPIAGELKRMLHIPGALFSVKPSAVQNIQGLFARNERVVCLFDTEIGPVSVIFVGALLIGSVVTSWHGQVMPKKSSNKIIDTPNIKFQRGDELGYFQWGSTVIVLFGENKIKLDSQLRPGDSVLMGQSVGRVWNDENNLHHSSSFYSTSAV